MKKEEEAVGKNYEVLVQKDLVRGALSLVLVPRKRLNYLIARNRSKHGGEVAVKL